MLQVLLAGSIHVALVDVDVLFLVSIFTFTCSMLLFLLSLLQFLGLYGALQVVLLHLWRHSAGVTAARLLVREVVRSHLF